MGGDLVMVAATLAVLGLPAERYLTTADPDERIVLRALARKAVEIVATLQQNQAILIANAIARSQRG